MNETAKWALIILAILLLVGMWGYVGAQEAQKVGVTCDMGAGSNENFCWKWHTNKIGQFNEGVNDYFNGNP